MNRKIVIMLLLLTVTALIAVPGGLGLSSYLNAFNAKYGTDGTNLDTCNTCHAGVPDLNPYGEAVAGQSGTIDQRLTNVESMDSDGDGLTNIEEINDLTFPGNVSDPGVTPTVSPTVTATVIPTVTATITPAVTETVTPTVSPTVTATATVTPTVTAIVIPTVTETVAPTVSPTVTVTGTPAAVTPIVTGTPSGPTPVPEFPAVILPVAAIMGLMLILLYRRRDR